MANITDPRVIRYVTEVVRPLAEVVKLLDADIAAAQAAFDQTVAPLIQANLDGDTVADGLVGVNAVTKADLYAVITTLVAIQGQINRQIVNKPCVRYLVTR